MTDLFLGQTRTKGWRLQSAGAAYTLVLPWQADMVVFNNLTKWTATAAGDARSWWFRDHNAAAQAYQQQVIDSAAGSSFNFLDTTTNGFTVADTTLGATDHEALISAVSKADPCVVTTSAVHGYQTDQLVRVTDLGPEMPTARGMDELEGLRFRITVLSTTTFSLQDPITDDNIDSTNFVTWVAGGRVQLESRSLTLNNPQTGVYSDTNPYNPTEFSYDPITYQLTAGTAVMADDNDLFVVVAYGFGSYENLGDIA